MPTLDDLLADIFDDRDPALYAEFAGWARDSRRFRAFAADYRAKIRAKLRNAHDDGGMLDLRAELETAALLLREERFTLEYETYAASKQRGPDFTVTFKTHTPFNVEVRRLRGAQPDEDGEARTTHLAAVLVDKVGQMPPGIVNLLWLIVEGERSEDDVGRAAAVLRRAADRKEEPFFTRRGFQNAADFVNRFGRLSGVVVRGPGGGELWLNPSARHKTPPDVTTAIRRLLA